jgi:hypothetical protein
MNIWAYIQKHYKPLTERVVYVGTLRTNASVVTHRVRSQPGPVSELWRVRDRRRGAVHELRMSAAPSELRPLPAPADPESTGLAARYDDPENPTELTLYDPDTDSQLTEWLSADTRTVRSLAAMR